MPLAKINHPAAIVGAVAYFIWGGIWFTVFSSQWVALIGKSSAPTQGPLPYIIAAVMALVLSYATAIALSHDDNRTAAHGARFGAFMGVAFVASTMLTGNTFEGRPLGLWLLDAAYAVLGMVIVGAIIGAWKKKPTTA